MSNVFKLLPLDQHFTFNSNFLLPGSVDSLDPDDPKKDCFNNVTIYDTGVWSGEGTDVSPYEIDSLYQNYCDTSNGEAMYYGGVGTPICDKPCQFEIKTSGTVHYSFINRGRSIFPSAYNDLTLTGERNIVPNPLYVFRGGLDLSKINQPVSGSYEIPQSYFNSQNSVYLTLSTDVSNFYGTNYIAYANDVKFWFVPYVISDNNNGGGGGGTDVDEDVDIYKPSDDCGCGSIFFPSNSTVNINNVSYRLMHKKDSLVNKGQKLITATSLISSNTAIIPTSLSIDFGSSLDIYAYNKLKMIVKTSDGGIIASKNINTNKQSQKTNNRIEFTCSNILSNHDISNKLIIVEVYSICDFSIEPCCEQMPVSLNLINPVYEISLPDRLIAPRPPDLPPISTKTQIPPVNRLFLRSNVYNNKFFDVSGYSGYDELNDDFYAYYRLQNNIFGRRSNKGTTLMYKLSHRYGPGSEPADVVTYRYLDTQQPPSSRNEINDVSFNLSVSYLKLLDDMSATRWLGSKTANSYGGLIVLTYYYTQLISTVYGITDVNNFNPGVFYHDFYFSVVSTSTSHPYYNYFNGVGCIGSKGNPCNPFPSIFI